MLLDWLVLALAAFFAGMVDAVVGGGGLIQIPALIGQFPQIALASLFGTNKLASLAGTASAAWRFARSVTLPWRVILPATGTALMGAWLGAASVTWIPRALMQPLVLVLMLGVAIYTFIRKDFGRKASREIIPYDLWWGMAIGLLIGFYDGFFGPGTGSFLIFAFVRLLGMDFLRAAASAKVINTATNIAAIAFFASHVPLLWGTGALMACCNIVGAQVGTAIALKRGQGFIRLAFLAVVSMLIIKMTADMIQ